MNKRSREEWSALARKAAAGDRQAMEEIVRELQTPVFNLALRMLGSFQDAEDATQEIMLKILAGLPSFRAESALPTWAFSIAVNHLRSDQKSRFAHQPLSFEFYAMDIENGRARSQRDLTENVDRGLLAEELKLSCTNVMLQCLDAESRCIFVLGTMFRPDSRVAAELLGIRPEAYRQRLSRIRRKMAGFLEQYCGEYGGGRCRCRERLNYAIESHRLNPTCLEYTQAVEIPMETLSGVKQAMEEIDELSQAFAFCKAYRPPETLARRLQSILESPPFAAVRGAERP